MTEFKVWAPAAKTVELSLGDERLPMQPGETGWWTVDAPQAGPGSDYAFALDGGGRPLPDPRSRWQPQGVHGPSRWVDLSAFQWDDKGWQPPPLSAAVIYELHTGTFTPAGTFEAIIEKLDYLRDLGITHLELMPVAEFPGARGWGYDGVDLYAPHHAYGGPEGLHRLVNACHRKGLAVLLDVVYNHLGPEGNYLGQFGPYFTDRYSTLWGDAVNFDGPGSDEVRRFFLDNARMWLRDYHVDGLRLDAVQAIFDISALHFLEELALEVGHLEAQVGRHLVLIAESDLNDPRLVRPIEAGGYGLDAQWSDDFHHALHAVLTGENSRYYADFGSLADLATAFQEVFVYGGRYAGHRDRRHGRPLLGDRPHRFLAYLQTHDQIGNRAQGDRISHLINPDRAKLGQALVFASPFIPMLFQGEEWGASSPFLYFTDHPDPALAQAITKGRREEFAHFGWAPDQVPDPQDPETFRRCKLDWAEQGRPPHAELLDWHRRLIALRKAQPALSASSLNEVNVRFNEEAKWIVVERGPVALACNLAEQPRSVPLEQDYQEVLLASKPGIALVSASIDLPPNSAAFLR